MSKHRYGNVRKAEKKFYIFNLQTGKWHRKRSIDMADTVHGASRFTECDTLNILHYDYGKIPDQMRGLVDIAIPVDDKQLIKRMQEFLDINEGINVWNFKTFRYDLYDLKQGKWIHGYDSNVTANLKDEGFSYTRIKQICKKNHRNVVYVPIPIRRSQLVYWHKQLMQMI